MKRMAFKTLAALCAVVLVMVAVPVSYTASAANQMLLYEGFESGTSLPNGWSTYDADGDGLSY